MLKQPYAVFGAGALFLWAGLAAQETLSSVQRDLARVEKEIDREKELHKTERKRAADFENDKATKTRALQEQMRLTQGKIDSLKRQLERARQQKGGFRNQAALYQGKQKEFLKSLTVRTREFAASLKSDFPYLKEKRVSDLEELATAMESGVVGVEDGVNRLFTLLQSSLDLGYEVEVYRGTYAATDGSNHEGNFVRLGAAVLAFAGEDGKVAAFLVKQDTGYVWQDKDLAPEIRQDIFTTVKVAQGKVAPQLVNLPFSAPKPKEAGR